MQVPSLPFQTTTNRGTPTPPVQNVQNLSTECLSVQPTPDLRKATWACLLPPTPSHCVMCVCVACRLDAVLHDGTRVAFGTWQVGL